MSIFGDREAPGKPIMVRKPKASCRRCNGTGSFSWEPSMKVKGISLFGKESVVMCPCVKLVKND